MRSLYLYLVIKKIRQKICLCITLKKKTFMLDKEKSLKPYVLHVNMKVDVFHFVDAGMLILMLIPIFGLFYFYFVFISFFFF